MSDGDELLARFFAAPDDDTLRLVYADWIQEAGDEAKAKGIRSPVAKRFGVDFHSGGGALTLDPLEVNDVHEATGWFARTHKDGWTITGEVHEDYYYWVNDFAASHPEHGLVWGDFESVVFASSEAGFQHFYANHTPGAWDYHDI